MRPGCCRAKAHKPTHLGYHHEYPALPATSVPAPLHDETGPTTGKAWSIRQPAVPRARPALGWGIRGGALGGPGKKA